MELYIDRDEFCHGLARAQGVAVTRSTQPACSHVLLTSQAAAQVQGLRITATDTEVTYQGDLAANVKSPGSVAVNSAQLFQIVRAMPAVTVRLATKSGGGGKSGVSGLEVGSGRVSFRLPSIPEEEFPFLADFKPTATATLAERDLHRVLDQTHFSVAAEDVRWGLNGAHMEAATERPTHLRVVTTDGHRLSCAEAPFTGSVRFPSRMLVPRKAISLMRRMLESAEQVHLDYGDSAMRLRRSSETLWFRLLDGEFPDYRAVMTTDARLSATVNRSELIAALKRVALMTAKERPARFNFGRDAVEIRTFSLDKGDVREALPVKLGDGCMPFEVGFNVRYLAEALAALHGDEVSLSLGTPLSPCLVRDPDIDRCDDARFVVMPMRLD